MRPTSTFSSGRSFIDALTAKYISDAQTQRHDGVEAFILGSSRGTIEVEAPALYRVRNKLSHVERLREVSLDGECVASPGEEGRISQLCPSEIRSVILNRYHLHGAMLSL
jgi:hypothetical protein